MYRFPKVIEYTENGTKFRAEYDKEYDDGECFYLVYHWYANESVGPFKEPQEIGCWLVYCHQTFTGIMEIMNKEKTKMKQLKPFNLEQALAGAPVVCRKGYPIVELKYLQTTSNLAVVRKEDDEKLISYFVPCSGKLSDTIDYATDLFMAPAKKEAWVVMFHNNSQKDFIVGTKIWASKQDAEIWSKGCEAVFAIAKIEWEE